MQKKKRICRQHLIFKIKFHNKVNPKEKLKSLAIAWLLCALHKVTVSRRCVLPLEFQRQGKEGESFISRENTL